MPVRRIQTNKEIYDRIVEFLPKLQGKNTVTRDTIIELHKLGKDAGFSIPSSNCGGCDNKKIIDNLTAYQYQFEHPDE